VTPGRMNCWSCETPMIWGCDFDNEDEEYGYGQDEYAIFSTFTCPNCKAEAVFFHYTGDNQCTG